MASHYSGLKNQSACVIILHNSTKSNSNRQLSKYLEIGETMLQRVIPWILGRVGYDELFKNMVEYSSINLIYFYILIILILLMLFGLINFIYRKVRKKKIDVIMVITFVTTALSGTAIYALGDSYDSMCKDYYEEAAELCNAYHYQDAKILYQKIPGYRDSREKTAECDYQSAQQCFANGEYTKAYELLFPWLAYPDETEDFAVIADMRQLLIHNTTQVSLYCGESGIFQDFAWMLGKWSNEMGDYVLFRMDDNDKTYFCQYNIDGGSTISDDNPLNYSDGLYWSQYAKQMNGFIFCPITNNSAYVYNILTGQMFLFNRE